MSKNWKIECSICKQAVYAKSLSDARKKFEQLWRCEMTMTETVEVEGKLVVGFGIKKSGNPISEAKGRCVGHISFSD